VLKNKPLSFLEVYNSRKAVKYKQVKTDVSKSNSFTNTGRRPGNQSPFFTPNWNLKMAANKCKFGITVRIICINEKTSGLP
jgi:hypothetical protein